MMDPLHINKAGAPRMVARYLKEEAANKLNVHQNDFIAPVVVEPDCPGQDNFTDCGVFCLHYMKSLYQYPDEMMTTLYVKYTHPQQQ